MDNLILSLILIFSIATLLVCVITPVLICKSQKPRRNRVVHLESQTQDLAPETTEDRPPRYSQLFGKSFKMFHWINIFMKINQCVFIVKRNLQFILTYKTTHIENRWLGSVRQETIFFFVFRLFFSGKFFDLFSESLLFGNYFGVKVINYTPQNQYYQRI